MKTDRTIFISSTFRDLENHRKALIEALHDLVWLRVMESRGASAGNAIENCHRWVRDSDVYLSIIGMCYGSREPNSGKSFTELEYDEAMRLNLPCLIYLIDEERHALPPSSVDRGKDAEDLAQFKAKISRVNHRGLFRSPEHLQYQVTRDLINLFDDLSWWIPNQKPIGDGLPPRKNEWRIQLCAWGSPQGIIDLSDRFTEEEREETDIAASILVSRFQQGDFTILREVITLKSEIRSAIRSFLAVRDIDETSLSGEIRNSHIGLYLRLLIDLAGLARSRECVEAICDQVLHSGRKWDQELHDLGYSMRSFLSVSAEALGRMPSSAAPLIAEYVKRARTEKQWHAKKMFEKALQHIGAQSSGSTS